MTNVIDGDAACSASVDLEADDKRPAINAEEDKDADEQLSSPGISDDASSPANSSPPPLAHLTVDPSVRFRDASKTGWAARQDMSYQGIGFVNPLFGDPGSTPSSPDSAQPASPSIPASSLKAASVPSAMAGPSNTDLSWQAKQAARSSTLALDRGASDAAHGFRLLATPELPSASPEGSRTASMLAQASISTHVSPGKLPQGQAQRKLTGAKTIRPQDLSLAALEEGDGGEEAAEPGAGSGGSFSQPQHRSYGCSSQQAEVSGGTLWAVHASTDSPAQTEVRDPASGCKTSISRGGMKEQASLHGLRLLTPQQFKVGRRVCCWIWPALTKAAGSCFTGPSCTSSARMYRSKCR